MAVTTGDVHDYLNSLLVTDRPALGFLHKNVIGGQETPTLEQVVVDLVKHVRDHQGAAPRNLKHWLGSLGSLERRYQTCVILLCGYYRDASLAPNFQGVLRQLTYVALHPAAVAALAQTMGIRASQVLTEMLWSTPVSQWHLRETAILRHLGRLGWTSSIEHLLRALSVPYDHPVQVAAEALAQFEVADVQPRLLEILDSASPARQRAGAAEALGLLGDPGALGVLQHASTRATDPRLLTAIVVARARLGDPGAEAVLVNLATHDQGHHLAEVRIRAIGALGLLGQREADPLSREALDALLRGLGDSQPEVRSEAARALGGMGHAPAARPIAQALRKEVSPLVRSALIQALGRLGSAASLPILLDFLRRDTRGVQIEILGALSQFPNPNLVEHISPFRNANDAEVREAAERALRRLLYRPFGWPGAAPIEQEVVIPVYTLHDARRLLLPPPPPQPEPGFFARFFGGAPAPSAPARPSPIGQLLLSPRGMRLTLASGGEPGWRPGEVAWERRFGVHVTREPIGEEGSNPSEDIGIHFTLRQRASQGGAQFETVAVSLWCAPSPAVGRIQAKSERLPCLDPHQAAPFLAALRYYLEVHGEPLPFVV